MCVEEWMEGWGGVGVGVGGRGAGEPLRGHPRGRPWGRPMRRPGGSLGDWLVIRFGDNFGGH